MSSESESRGSFVEAELAFLAALKPDPLANAPKPSDAADEAVFPLPGEEAASLELSNGAAIAAPFEPGGGEGAEEAGDVAPDTPLFGVWDPKLDPRALGFSPPEAEAGAVGAASHDREPLAPVTKGDEDVEVVKEAKVGCVRGEAGAPDASAGADLDSFALLLKEANVGCVFTGALTASGLLPVPASAIGTWSESFADRTLSSVVPRLAGFSCQSRSCTLLRICPIPGPSPSAPSIEVRVAVAEPAALPAAVSSFTSSCGSNRFFFAGTASGVDRPCPHRPLIRH